MYGPLMRHCITIMKNGVFSTTRYASSQKSEYYPSAALFQKPTAEIDQESAARFIEPTG